MKLFRVILVTCAVGALAAGCGSSGGGGSKSNNNNNSTTGKNGQVRTVTGALKNTSGKAAVSGKTEKGTVVKATIDPKTRKFALNLPKNQKAVITVKVGDITKKVKFPRAPLGKSDAGDEFGYQIPQFSFEKDADLGELDFDEGDEIICGDEDSENSIWEYVDSDDDGTVDWMDDSNADWSDDLAWLGGDDWGSDEWYEENDFCDLDGQDICYPEDDEFFSEDECGETDAAEWCSFSGEDGWYDNGAGEGDEGSEWWDDPSDDWTDVPDDGNPDDGNPDDICSDCAASCASIPGAPANCVSICESECDGGGNGDGGNGDGGNGDGGNGDGGNGDGGDSCLSLCEQYCESPGAPDGCLDMCASECGG